MNTALWIVTGLLAAAYFFGGGGKAFVPKDRIYAASDSAHWVEDFSPLAVKCIGVLEMTAAVGLILPAVLDITPILVSLAAVGLLMIMIGAVITRIRRHEFKLMVVDLTYAALLSFVIWGRLGPEQFS